MTEWRPRSCQWIEPDLDILDALDNGEPLFRCTAPLEPGASYCARHLDICAVRQCQWIEGCDSKPVNGTRLCRRHHAERERRLAGKGAAA